MSEQLQVKPEQDFCFVCPSNEFRKVIEALQPINDVLALQVSPSGMHLGAMDPSHVSMVVADLESSFFTFQDWDSRTIKSALQIDSLLKFWPTDVHVSPIQFKISPEKTIMSVESSGLIKTFAIATATTSDGVTLPDEKKYVPTTEISVGVNVWRDAVTTISKMSRDMQLEAHSISLVLTAFEPDCVPALLAGSCNIPFAGKIQNDLAVHYPTSNLLPFLEPLAKLADHILLAFGSDMPLRITAKIHHGTCRFWFAPRIYGDSPS